MGNLFYSKYAIHRRFDLKGSSHGCTTDKLEAEIDATTTLKDLTLISSFNWKRLGSNSFASKFLFNSFFPCLQVIYVYTWFSFLSWSVASHRQVDRDCDLLEHERIMDYSLLVGLHLWEALRTRTPSGIRTPTGYFLSLHSSLFPYMNWSWILAERM